MSEKAPGFEDYMPNRLDWLAVMSNSLFYQPSIREAGFTIVFLPSEDGKTIILMVKHHEDLNKDYLDGAIELAKDFVLLIARNYGWDSWIQIETQIATIERKEDKKNNSSDE